MKVIIPAAGKGTRLRPLTYSISKPLLRIGSKRIIDFIMNKVLQFNPEKIIFIVNPKESLLQQYIHSRYENINVAFKVQKDPKGLGDAVLVAIEDETESDLLIWLGDTLIDYSYNINLSTSIIAVNRVSNPQSFGIVELDREKRITNMIEKPQNPPTNLAIIGVYYLKSLFKLKKSIIYLKEKNIKTKDEYQLTDALKLLLDKGEIFKAVEVEEWYDCGNVKQLLENNKKLLIKTHKNFKIPGVVINEPVYISPTAKVRNSIIGPFTTIGDKVTVESSIVENSLVDDNTEIKNSLILDSVIGQYSIIDGVKWRGVIGNHSEIYI